MIERGVYRMSFRGLSLAEGWRLGSPAALPIVVFLKLFGVKGDYQWLPALECETFCEPEELSEEALAHLEPIAERLAYLGYSPSRYSRVTTVLDPKHRDAGAFRAMHSDGKRMMFVAYVSMENPGGTPDAGGGKLQKAVQVFGSFLTEGRRSAQDVRAVAVLNHKTYLDYGGYCKVVRLPETATVDEMDRGLAQELNASKDRVIQFRSFEEACDLAFALEDKVWETRIARGLFFKVSPEEERQVLARFGYDASGKPARPLDDDRWDEL